ncbi:MAG: hypothetical protein GF419_10915 [Ignavibacteriales bacterium]|nr:hypothetical protein [Ignavibacteriales bacterium]
MLPNLLLKSASRWQLWGAFVGSLVGAFLVFFSLQTFIDVRALFEDERYLLSDEIVVITKKVSLLHTAGVARSEFSPDEIEDVKEQAFVEQVAPFEHTNFPAKGFTDLGGQTRGLYSDVFFEAIPDRFLDQTPEDWGWNEGDSVVPVVVPRDYLALYNVGYAPGRNMPRLSAETISMIKFELHIFGDHGRDEYLGRIVGLTDRVNSALVPIDFMRWANRKYADDPDPAPKKLLLLVSDPADPDLAEYLEKRGYETNLDKLRGSKVRELLNAAVVAVGAVGAFVATLAFVIFLVSMQLAIARSSEKIRLLILLGYDYTRISRLYASVTAAALVLSQIVVFALVYVAKLGMTGYFAVVGFKLPSGVSAWVWIGGALFALGLAAINAWAVNSQVKKLA